MGAKARAYVLDSFAVLAYLAAEAGMPRVREVLRDASAGRGSVYLSLINLGQVAYIVERERGLARAQETLGLIDQLPIQILPASREAVMAAAHVKAEYPMAYADAFAVAAAQILDAVILTGDPEFEAVKDLVHVERL
ncbi:MAG: type II toxin-antitoxin system VapC family toxin [Chloroflexi bacterium]|nr:type II toxin-antitoxin system VapC family toxin [Chloroflexota bacterium]